MSREFSRIRIYDYENIQAQYRVNRIGCFLSVLILLVLVGSVVVAMR